MKFGFLRKLLADVEHVSLKVDQEKLQHFLENHSTSKDEKNLSSTAIAGLIGAFPRNDSSVIAAKIWSCLGDHVLNILKLFSEVSLEQHINAEVLQKTLQRQFELKALDELLKNLKKITIINDKLFNECLCICSGYAETQIGFRIRRIIDNLGATTLHFETKNIEKIFALSDANLSRLLTLVENLSNTKLLSNAAFAEAMDLITKKLPPVEETVIDRKKRRLHQKARTEYQFSNHTSIFLQNGKPQRGGGCGEVKMGYISETDVKPAYAIKKLNENNRRNTEDDLAFEAKREVKFHHLLGRDAYYSKLKHHTIIATWQNGETLWNIGDEVLESIPIKNRLKALMNVFEEIAKLHANYYIHGDIKPLNIIFDLETEKMHLIDFGTSRKNASTKAFVSTQPYDDGVHFKDFLSDIYALGIVIAEAFPEIFVVSKFPFLEISYASKSLQTAEKAIAVLVDYMVNSERTMRPTIEDVLGYCRALHASYDDLTELKAKEFFAKTICHAQPTVTDVIRGRFFR